MVESPPQFGEVEGGPDGVGAVRGMAGMKILLIGSGGREHALADVILASPLTEKLFVAPGNDALAEIATCVDLAADDVEGLTRFAREMKIDLAVVGPETPLVLGIAD